MTESFHPLIKRLLDGELPRADVPAELRAEADEALRLVAAVDRTDVRLTSQLDDRAMREIREHAATRRHRAMTDPVLWRWLTAPSVPPWAAGALAAAAATLVLLLARPATPTNPGRDATAVKAESVYVRFVLFAPKASQVSLAGTFNQWDPKATPLVRAGTNGAWTVTVALPVGQHEYGFVVDGRRWVTDPTAPAVDDGFGRRNSVVSVNPMQGRAL
jgi:hypothetical protein